MNRFTCKQLFLSLCSLWWAISVSAQPKSPAALYPGLFEAVQMAQIYPDGKSFPDATPLQSPAEIMRQYNLQSGKPGFRLDSFVKQYFKTPAPNSNIYRSNIQAGVRKHIDTLWSVLQHVADTAKGTSLLPLPHPYIVPGGRFREVYYWDSYFTMLGLKDSRKYEVIQHICENFAYLIDTYGHIPNGNRNYYLTRSQPPYFSLMIELLAGIKGNQTLVKYRPELVKEYNYWLHGAGNLSAGNAFEHVVRMPDGSLLNRYWDAGNYPREESYRQDVLTAKESSQKPEDLYRNIRTAAESGWDFSSRWLADGKTLSTIQTTSFVEIDLNCLLYHLETVIAHAYTLSHDKAQAAVYTAKAASRKKAIMKYLWNPAYECFTDYNWQQRRPSNQATIATMYPLFFRIATHQQATAISELVRTRFLKPGGIATTLVPTGQQWDRPNGWAPLQYITNIGLINYHQQALAKTAAERWMKTNIDHFKATGRLVEKYDIESIGTKAGGGGEYPLQDGFGWTNGVLLRFLNMYNTDESQTSDERPTAALSKVPGDHGSS